MIELLKWYYLIGVAVYAALLCDQNFVKGLLNGVPPDAKPWQIIFGFFFVVAVMAPFWPFVIARLLRGKP